MAPIVAADTAIEMIRAIAISVYLRTFSRSLSLRR
jgi:hypothetical protein